MDTTVLRSILLFALAAAAESGGARLVWHGVREHRGWAWIGAGVVALGLYGFVATVQPAAHFGRILAAYGGVFVAGSLGWGMAVRHRADQPCSAPGVDNLGGVRVVIPVRAADCMTYGTRGAGFRHCDDLVFAAHQPK
ncbi:YnfA family protein [Streptomyces gardneri]|nr:YnfA family protein [Streptomyces gardneri]